MFSIVYTSVRGLANFTVLKRMTKLLGLDIGRVRVGLAVSDPTQMLARPLETLNRAKGKAEQFIVEMIKQEAISELVVGLPLLADGARSDQCDDIDNFCRRILKRVNVTIHYVDEYLSTQDALTLKASLKPNSKRSDVDKRIDAQAAALILQSFLNSRHELR